MSALKTMCEDEKELMDCILICFNVIYAPYNKPIYLKTEEENVKDILSSGGVLNTNIEEALKEPDKVYALNLDYSYIPSNTWLEYKPDHLIIDFSKEKPALDTGV